MNSRELPAISEMPYYKTSVPADKTQGQIMGLLDKYGIKDRQWTTLNGKETLRFIFDTTVQDRKIKLAVEMEIPKIKARKGVYSEIVSVPPAQVYRLFYYNLKSLLEATKYGLMKKEDLFFSYIITQLPDGTKKLIKDRVQEQGLLLPESFD